MTITIYSPLRRCRAFLHSLCIRIKLENTQTPLMVIVCIISVNHHIHFGPLFNPFLLSSSEKVNTNTTYCADICVFLRKYYKLFAAAAVHACILSVFEEYGVNTNTTHRIDVCVFVENIIKVTLLTIQRVFTSIIYFPW